MRKGVIKHFICYGKHMVIVRINKNAHVMTYDEWKKVYGKLHPQKWIKKSRKIA